MTRDRRRWLLLVVAAIVIVVTSIFAVVDLYLRGELRLNDPSPTRFPVRGIDVSHHQGPIAWSQVAEAGISFAFIKVSEGQDFTDTRFAENWQQAGEAGIARGAYLCFTFCSPGRSQANHFLASIDTLPRELPPVVDVEFAGNCRNYEDVGVIRDELREFVAQIETATGDAPLIYLTRESHRQIIRGHFPEYRLWVRDVYFQPARRLYGAWLFWQFTDNARIAGIDGPVDLNVFCCSHAEFEELAPGPSAVPHREL